MKRFLIVVDMQKDFVDGALGSPEAIAIVPAAVRKIRAFDGEIFATFDTHFADYLQTAEGKKLPVPHCISGTDGWQLDAQIALALQEKGFRAVEKYTFGSVDLPQLIAQAAGDEDFSIELIGLCTHNNIEGYFVTPSNALLLKANFPDKRIVVDPACCAGVTSALHDAALQTMASCQIEIV